MAQQDSPLLPGTIRALMAGWSEMNDLTDALIAKMRAPASDTRSADASKAFEALFMKSGAMVSACEAAKALDYTKFNNVNAWCTNYRNTLTVLAGSLRESPTVVVGAAALGNEHRVNEAVGLLEDMKKYAASVVGSLKSLLPAA